jgi:hypothetical protein
MRLTQSNKLAPGMLLAALLLAGCDSKPGADAPTTEVRGAPIQAAASRSNAAPSEVRGVPIQQASAVFTVTSTNPPGADVLPKASASGSGSAEFPLAGFDQLAGYAFDVSDDLLGPVTNDVAAVAAKTNSQIPESVRAFDQKRAAIKGFMLPLKVEGGLVTELLIMKDQSMCCYGSTPKINEWVSVKMAAKGVKALMDQPVTLMGTLHVGEMRENGYLIGIYRMDGEKMQAPEN